LEDRTTKKNKLSIELAGIEMRNPTMLASGFLAISQDVIRRIDRLNVGAIVSKSISYKPISGYRNPTVICLKGGSYINAVGLANPGSEAFAAEVLNNLQAPLIVSLIGSSEHDFARSLASFSSSKVLGYEINLSCPHVAKLGLEIGDDPEMVAKVVKTVKSITRKPVIAKIGIGNADMLEISRVAADAGVDAITAVNSVRAMAIDIEKKHPILSNKVGGLSGKSIKPIAVRCVFEIYKEVEVPVIGCGGVFTWEDAVEFILAGASAVQIGSAIAYEGLGVFERITSGLGQYLQNKRLNSVGDLVGLAHRC
jgi:dihydroorotate dehydrogenase (NAD+) catalytic subunit